ncbi:hypothetical protein GA0111570_101373 [Raineyella antarctica]|uniref:MEMO1 family protein n=2 Tax=Raineyella antarctica TaxID=1577474 RepID=A0A1G6GDM2_9ACTN|nr:hypothetical protein GA0111570_101373 [Raineyella antarctica]
MFYPGSSTDLARDVDDLLARAAVDVPAGASVPKAVIVPHAGYVYSGSTAALGFARLAAAADRITRVVLFGPCHRVAVRGLALPAAGAFRTPLGDVPIALPDLADLPQVVVSAAAHAAEHSLEVELPFLQRVLGDFELVPFAVGEVGGEDVAEVVDRLWGGPETVLVFSSDLSHYHPYAEAQRLDRETVDRLLALRGPIAPERACGARAVNGLLVSAARRGLVTELYGLCNSGDTAGDKRRVVGYAAIGVG